MKFVLLTLAFTLSLTANAMNSKETTTTCPYKSGVGLRANTQPQKGTVEAAARGHTANGKR